MGSGRWKLVFLSAVSLFSALMVCRDGGDAFPPGAWNRQEFRRPPEPPAPPPKEPEPQPVIFQMQYLPWRRESLNSSNVPVYGLALGYSQRQREIGGVSLALIHAFNARKSGLSMSLIEMSDESNGFAMFLAGGMLHNNGCSLGLWNMTENNRGLQIGLVNQAGKDMMLEYWMKPVEAKRTFGVQAGLVNYSDAPGIQFGLWNTNPNSFIKHFPLFNLCL